ncbi:hypothetical protein SSBR45G_30990 [Bradyrhizobium sp. SSBR45G]|nr:hypothetical protein SSBR45G_30990 [Bradyrhizobium sp. SSBR45G]GLH86043.1 hypothetical protein SSBR45R_35030 [Bradyrhizobium sp. SSBR45R]
MRQQHVDLDEIAHISAAFSQDTSEVRDDVGELRFKIIWQIAMGVEAGNAGDEEEIADPGAK